MPYRALLIIVSLLSYITMYAKPCNCVTFVMNECGWDSFIVEDSLQKKENLSPLDSIANVNKKDTVVSDDVVSAKIDTVVVDSALRYLHSLSKDSLAFSRELKVKDKMVPDPKKAMWLAIAFPGGGQIYNKKYWKLPIIYGGFLGCFYALNWNNTMYRDYSQAYIDIMDNDDNTNSFMNFLQPGYNVKQNLSWLKDSFKRKKNFYRRYRDMSMFCMIGVYLISIVDAYVDAEMSSFDISRDLTLKISPAIINDRSCAMRIPAMNGSSYGLNCSLKF